MRRFTLSLILLIIAPTAGASPDDIRPWGGHLPGAVAENRAVVQVFDAVTGRPVEGASVRVFDEAVGVGFLGAPLLWKTVTDEFGLASFPWKVRPRDAHWVFDAPGYAVMEEYGSFPPDHVWMLPGGEIRARLLDPFGRPAAGVHVELFLGCGRSPAVRIARTTAEGLFRFRGVRPRRGYLWFRMAGAFAEYADVPANGGAVTTRPGRTVTGIVTDREGQPVAGVVVASTQTHRGPATTTGVDGRFRLDGVDPSEGVWLHHDSYAGMERPFVYLEEDEIPFQPGRDIFLRLVVPPSEVESDDYFEFLAPGAIAVPVRVTDAGTGEDLPDVPFRLVSEKTGLGVVDDEETDEEYDPTGRRVVMVPPGRYRVMSGDPFDVYRVVPPAKTVVVPEGKPSPITAVAVRNPVLHVAGAPGNAFDLEFLLLVPGAWTSFEPGSDADPVHLPPEGAAVVRARDPDDGTVRHFPVGPVKEGVRTATVSWKPVEPAPTVEEGEPWPGVGPIRLVDAAGRPIAGRKFRIDRRSRASWGETDEEGRLASRGMSGRSSGGEFVSLPEKLVGPPFRLELDGYVSRMLAPEKPGELTIRYPAGVIDLTITAEDGEFDDFGWCVDGMTGRGIGGRLTLRGVEPGRRKVVVGAAGYGSVLCLIDVPAEGVKTLRVVLGR